MDIKKLLALDMSARGVTVMKLTISLPSPGLGLFPSPTILNDNMVGYYYSSQVYAKRTNERHEAKRYGVGVIQVTAKLFQK